MTKTPRTITIMGRKWFDKVNGNTYHSATILVDGRHVHKVDYEYGYGDQYVWSAWEWLDANGYIKIKRYSNGGTEAPWQYCDREGIVLFYTATDVNHKKDL